MNLEKINYNNLFSFHVIASQGSISGASAVLGVAPSTLSEQLSQLEKAFRIQLFDRKNARLILNESGRIVFQHTRVMFKTSERLMHSLRAGQATSKINLDVGISSSVSRGFALELLLPLFEDNSVHVRIRNADYDFLIDDLFTQEIDLLLSDREPTEVLKKDLVSEAIVRSSLLLVAREKYAKLYLSKEQPLPFLNYSPHSNYRMEVDRFFDSRGIFLGPIGELDDTLLMKAAVSQGICCAVLPAPIVRKELESGEFVVLDTLPDIESQVFMSYHQNKPLEHVARAIERLRGSMAISKSSPHSLNGKNMPPGKPSEHTQEGVDHEHRP